MYGIELEINQVYMQVLQQKNQRTRPAFKKCMFATTFCRKEFECVKQMKLAGFIMNFKLHQQANISNKSKIQFSVFVPQELNVLNKNNHIKLWSKQCISAGDPSKPMSVSISQRPTIERYYEVPGWVYSVSSSLKFLYFKSSFFVPATTLKNWTTWQGSLLMKQSSSLNERTAVSL